MSASPTGKAGSDRLSVTRLRSRPRRPIAPDELKTLRTVADALIPGADDMPPGSSIRDFERLADTALAILDRQFEEITDVLAGLRSAGKADMFDRLRDLADADPDRFYALSLVVVAVYVYSPEVTAVLGYPRPHRDPPGLMDAVNELETGILDPVSERGPVYTALT